MHMEGNIRRVSAAFFESPGFRTFNFALLERLSNIQHTTKGFTELDLSRPANQKKLKLSLKKLNSVVESLQQLLDISQAFKSAELQTIHPEKVFVLLHRNYGWAAMPPSTYQSLLVTVPEKALAALLAQIFVIEKVATHKVSVTFRRRQSNVVVRIYTPKSSWVHSQLSTILRQGDACLPLQSDTLEVILLRAVICVLQNFDIQLSIFSRQQNCLYVYLPSARQMQVFAENNIEE